MVIFMGLVLLVWNVCSAIKGGLFRPFFLEGLSIEESIKNNPSFENDEKSVKYVLKMLGVLILAMTIFIISIAFMVCALSIDTLLIPTIFMLVWTIGGIVRISVSKKEREKTNKQDYSKPNNTTRFKNLISLVYVIYILVLIIIAI